MCNRVMEGMLELKEETPLASADLAKVSKVIDLTENFLGHLSPSDVYK